ncbi:hypothetical protein E2C01_060489 [Portunus trituberculatus]|uniref:Uncharacterized protein n=1 Tax=Portunus trituberculatus TaxID=210409 RepID=A0A5B7H1A7_PORTR|nr:hypothetical protein [Portunus trituberculatus]
MNVGKHETREGECGSRRKVWSGKLTGDASGGADDGSGGGGGGRDGVDIQKTFASFIQLNEG